MNESVFTKNLMKFATGSLGFRAALITLLALAPFSRLTAEPTARSGPTIINVPPEMAALHVDDDPVSDANIARTTAELLGAWHYSQHPFDQEISSKFLDQCLRLDYDHMFFLQSDLDEFEKYRTTLGTLTLKKRDLSPCWVMFSRFLDRMNERTTYSTNLLLTEKFDFTGHERFTPDRHTLPAPKTIADAQALWKQDVRFRYLEEKLKAPNIQFTGPIETNGGKITVSLKRDKTHPQSFDLLPQNLVDEKGASFGTVEIGANTSNAVVHLQVPSEASLRKFTNSFYLNGARLGGVSVQREVAESTSTNSPESTNSQPVKSTVTYQAVLDLDRKDTGEIVKGLTNYYATVLRNYNDLTKQHFVLEWYLNSLAHAYDPHSDYMGPDSAENFRIQMNLTLFGIGARLRLDGQYCKIEDLVPEGPASKSGQLKSGDSIVAVAQKGQDAINVIGMPLQKVVDQIRGPKGTEVTLTILPNNADDPSIRKKVTLIRDEIKLEDQRAKAKLYETPDANGGSQRIGVIDLSSFYGEMDHEGAGHEIKSTTLDVVKLIDRLKKEKVDGIILDLRRNGGGFLEEAIKLTGLFIRPGPVVQTKEFNGEIVGDSCTDPVVHYEGPLIVMTSRFSASASEILAGALQDYGRALIVGDKSTFGKGTVQTMQPLMPFLKQNDRECKYPDAGSLKVTIKKFYRAGGSSTQLNGVIPEIVLPSRLNVDPEIGEVALPNALPWDDTTSADFKKYNMVNPYQPELLSRSTARQKKEKDFAYVLEDIEEYEKMLADKSLSMNEADRLMEQSQRAARTEARRKERASRKKTNEKVYDLTLQNVAKPLELAKNSATPKVAPDDDADSETADSGAGEAVFSDEEIRLTETRRIMSDYIDLLRKAPAISAARGQVHNLANPVSTQ
jgi:carboxyl-terminal processing protease